MGFLDALKRLVSNPQEAPILWLRVRCDRCGEIIESRVNLYNDLSAEHDGSEITHRLRKVLIGSGHCYQQVEVEMTFDAQRRVLTRQIRGGTFVEDEEGDGG